MSDDVSNDDVADSPAASDVEPSSSHESSDGHGNRRRFFEYASLGLGAIVSIGPAIIGLLAFLDPLRRKPGKPTAYQEAGGNGGDGLLRVASLDALTADTPQRFAVIDDKIDAWNFTPHQPIGSVYIEKLSNGDVRIFNTTCPHAGCSVALQGNEYRCPCHNSAFQKDGAKLNSKSGRENPSPRDLDTLAYEIRDGEIWIDFKNFYTGKHDKKAKV